MRICTITCNNADNYGARLQAYALQRYLEMQGHQVQVIDYEPDYMRFNTRLWYNPGLNPKEWAKFFLRFGQRRRAIAKHRRLEEFSRRYLKLTRKYSSIDQLRADPPAADMYVAGSDQIWNTSFANGKDPAYYLDFGPDSVSRMSYAASFALPEVPEPMHRFVGERLSRLDTITVREASAVPIVERLGFDAVHVCDPVLLLSPEFWGEEFADGEGEGCGYVLVYDFERSDDLRRVAQYIARRYGLQIFSVSPWHLSYADRNYCDCAPESFVALFKNASYVVSNSLHGSIFSLIFDRQFFVVNRADGLNVRMADLLAILDDSNRIVTPQTIAQVLDGDPDPRQHGPRYNAHVGASRSLLQSLPK